MFSYTPRASRRVRLVSAALAVGAMVVGFGLTAGSASAADEGPVNSSAPVITGYTAVGNSAVVNNTLTVSDGAWTNDPAATGQPITYEYSWFNGNDDFLGDGSTYIIQSRDIGETIYAQVAATDANDVQNSAESARSTAVVDSDVSNTSEPVLSGSASPGSTLSVTTGSWVGTAPITYSYEWFETSGQDGGPLDTPDITSVHTIDAADFGLYIGVLVTATDGKGHQATSRETTATVVTPVAPFATDAGLTSENEGGVTGSQTKTDATVVLPSNGDPVKPDSTVHPAIISQGVSAGSIVYVYGYSTPTPIGFFSVTAANTITVPLGALPKGLHKLAIIDANGNLIGWLSVTAGGGLASTGVNVNAPLELGGAALLILLGIFSVVFVTRRRRVTAGL
jgi:hypothetical protein